jgi:hypothetical protein
MRLTTFDNRRWYTVRDPNNGAGHGDERSLGSALETAVRIVGGWAQRDRVEIWECEGTSSYTSTHLLNVARLDDGIMITEAK